MHNGRILQMSGELLFGSAVCLTAAVLTPLSFWHSLGESGAGILTLAAGALVTGLIVVRHSRSVAPCQELIPSPAIQSAN
jgi:hypothetical protein